MQGVTLLGKAQYGKYATFQNTSPLIGAILIWNWSTHLDPLQSSDKSKTLHAATLMRTLGGFKFPQTHFNWGFPTQHEIYSSKFECHFAFAFVRTSQPQWWALTVTVNNLTEDEKEQLWRQNADFWSLLTNFKNLVIQVCIQMFRPAHWGLKHMDEKIGTVIRSCLYCWFPCLHC